MMDLDRWAERSAIMEFDGGLSRFSAETEAARAQGYQRHEVINAYRKRNSPSSRDQRQTAARNAACHVPGVQPLSQEEAGRLPERDIQAGRGGLELLALRNERGAVL
ncbi:hypothetical protein [Tropicimonas sp. IMCC34011]|uniref:hypothetical protein n=1 Tax=Tropicimonas sp. IMCC34011 TaxID=2248759 RepID=UPI001300B3D3|nr:hypothetical protein [Tropicimonas sp. IMCC34011]